MFQLVQCRVNIGARGDTIVVTDPPVTYPEYLLLRYIHGEGAVTEPCDAGEVDVDDIEERRRLGQKYGDKLVGEIFPGAFARLPARGDMPTIEEHREIIRAADEAASAVRAKQKGKAGTKPTTKPAGAAPAGKQVDLGAADTSVDGVKKD